MHFEQLAALRERVDGAHDSFFTACDRATRAGSKIRPDQIDELRQATDRLMRALAAVMLFLGEG